MPSKGNKPLSSKSTPTTPAPPLDAARRRAPARIPRVDHACELGARQISAGQLAVFGGTPGGSVIAHMAAQEQKHLDAFDRLGVERRVRPTARLPVWDAAGFALGLGTALMGKEAAMACTGAVEEEVTAEHYGEQLSELSKEGWDGEAEIARA